MIRPELQEALVKWREVLIGLAIAVFGAWWSVTANGLVAFLGYAAVALGVVLMIGAWQRLRFQAEGQGPGVVKIVERRLAYFGPLEGGTMEMDDLIKLEVDGLSYPTHWVLTSALGQVLRFPVNAEGADALFDLFESLPGIQTEAMLSVLNRTPDQRVVIWERSAPLLQ